MLIKLGSRLQRGSLRGELGVRETLEEQAQRGGDFETGQRGAEAEVDAVSEGEVFLAGAGGVEAVGVLMPGRGGGWRQRRRRGSPLRS